MLHDYGATEPSFGTAPFALIEGFGQLPGVEVHVISCLRQPVRSPAKLADNVFFHCLRVPKVGWIRTFYLGCIRAVRQKLDEISPDVVHGQGTERDSAMTAAFSGRPNVITIHGNMRQVAKVLGTKPFSFYWIASRLEALAVRKTGGVVCLSHYTREQVQDQARKTWVVPNAVRSSFFQIEREGSTDFTILCVAHLSPRKNQNALIRSLDAIATKKRFRLIFAGGINPVHPYCLEFLELVKSRTWCVYEGNKTEGELRAYLKSAGLLVLPSLEDNCPMVVLEAMAAGVPVAASRIGGIPDLIEDNVSGLLFDPLKPPEISRAVEAMIENPQAAAEMGARGKIRALQKHRPIIVAQEHLNIYQELLRASPVRGTLT